MDYTSAFQEAYNNVFDGNDNIKVCGRNACGELIMICNKIDKKNYYGDVKTGFMNADAMRKLHKAINAGLVINNDI